MHTTKASQRTRKVFLALQYIVRSIFRIPNVIAVRIGRSIHHTSAFANATGSILIYYEDDNDPTFYNYDTKDTALDIRDITGSNKSRVV